MEERKSYGMVMLFVSVFVVFLVSIMSYSLWRDKQISAFMATNRAWGIQCDRESQVAWVVRGGERVNLTINDFPLYCSGQRIHYRMLNQPAEPAQRGQNESGTGLNHDFLPALLHLVRTGEGQVCPASSAFRQC